MGLENGTVGLKMIGVLDLGHLSAPLFIANKSLPPQNIQQHSINKNIWQLNVNRLSVFFTSLHLINMLVRSRILPS